MIRHTQKISEGDLFLIGKDPNNKFLGLIGRRKGRTKLLLGYFWRVQFEIDDDVQLNKDDSILISMFSALGFELGGWVVLGRYKKWEREEWGFPEFKRLDIFFKRWYGVSYNEKFEEIDSRNISDAEAQQLFKDGSHGYESLENRLATLA